MAREKLCRKISVGFQTKKSFFSLRNGSDYCENHEVRENLCAYDVRRHSKWYRKYRRSAKKSQKKVTLETTAHPSNEVRSSLSNATRGGRKSRIGKKLELCTNKRKEPMLKSQISFICQKQKQKIIFLQGKRKINYSPEILFCSSSKTNKLFGNLFDFWQNILVSY